jgi:hypothetical protein
VWAVDWSMSRTAVCWRSIAAWSRSAAEWSRFLSGVVAVCGGGGPVARGGGALGCGGDSVGGVDVVGRGVECVEGFAEDVLDGASVLICGKSAEFLPGLQEQAGESACERVGGVVALCGILVA